MGNDIFWSGRQPDGAKQRECLTMLQTTAQKPKWEHQVFDGPLEGPFEDYSRRGTVKPCTAEEIRTEREATNPGETRNPILEVLERLEPITSCSFEYQDELSLCGIIIYPWGMDRPDYMGYHVTFLFDNSEHLPEEDRGVLIDLFFDHCGYLSEEQRQDLIAYGIDPDEDGMTWPSFKKGKIRRGGAVRMGGEAYAFMWLLLWIRERCIPSLQVSDDYSVFEDAEKQADKMEWLQALRSAEDEALLEPLYLDLLSFLGKEISWGAVRTSFDDMEKNWERMLMHVKALKDQELYPIEAFQKHFEVPSGVDLDQVSVHALFLSSLEHHILQDHGIHSMRQLLNQTDDGIIRIPEITLLPETLRHIKEQLHFFFSRLDEIPNGILKGYALKQPEQNEE